MINQLRFAKNVRFFKPGFKDRWDLDDYNDTNAPCFFAGVYTKEDVDVINNHKGFKVIWNTGRLRSCFDAINPHNVVVMIGNGVEADIPDRYKSKSVNIEIKDFSMFVPNILGPEVYFYIGNNKQRKLYGYDLVKKISKRIPFPVQYAGQGHTMKEVKENYYDNCFVNIKPIIHGGLTTATELAFMGRKTISNTKADFCIGYDNIDEIVDIIEQESQKIGTVQPNLIRDTFEGTGAWRHESFWI